MFMNEIVSRIMKANRVRQQKLAEAIGKTRATDISSRLSVPNMTLNNAIEMLTAMGYQVVVRPKSALGAGEYEVTHTKGFVPLNTFEVVAQSELSPTDRLISRVNESLRELIDEFTLAAADSPAETPGGTAQS